MRILKTSAIAILVLAGVFAWQWWERRTAPEADACFGLPRSQATDLRRGVLVLRNAGFTAGYSELLANPLWVSYRLGPAKWPAPDRRPEEGFRRDERSLRGIGPDAFFGTGYQRGHLAPNYAMYRVHGPEAQRDSFLMTNITPQRPDLNQKAWQRLEEVIMDRLLPHDGSLCIFAGPVFDKTPRILPSGVAVPDAFYKLVVAAAEHPGSWPFSFRNGYREPSLWMTFSSR